jgi:hypothetical protein
VPGDPPVCTTTCDPTTVCGAGLDCRPVTRELAACLPPFELLRGYQPAPGCQVLPGRRPPRPGAPLVLLLAMAALVTGSRWPRRSATGRDVRRARPLR